MKKLYTLFAAGLVSVFAMAQSSINLTNPQILKHARTPLSIPHHNPQPLTPMTYVIDYDSADEYVWNNPSNYVHYIWDFNWHYAASDSALKYFDVAFDSLYDTYGAIGYAHTGVTSVRVDSVFMILGQENNSGTDDTLITKLINVNANGYPQSTAYWTDTTIIAAGSPFGTNWLQAVRLSIPCGFTVPSYHFAVRCEYHGNKMDTCGWLAGFDNHGACGSGSVSANQTNFAPWKYSSTGYYTGNTFALYTQYASFGTLPTSSAQFLYYDCNSNSAYDAGTDGETYLQNMTVSIQVTTNPNGVQENAALGVKLFPNMPNPFNDNTTVAYELTSGSSVALSVYDITGKEIMNFNEGKQAAGRHEININGSSLQAGVYFYALTVNGSRLTNKMTVIK